MIRTLNTQHHSFFSKVCQEDFINPTAENLFGLYVHWPYCLSKCPYCDFFSLAQRNPDESLLFEAYARDIKRFAAHQRLTSIFFGGGTPSLMSLSLFENLMRLIRDVFDTAPDMEVTLEANPDAITKEKMKLFKQAGVTRLSLGIQSLSESGLKQLGRRHDALTALKRVETARSIFPFVSIDLIYARPGQTQSAWQEELTQALQLDLSHYSLYQLSIEKGTVFYKQGLHPAEETLAVALYDQTTDQMTQAGCPPYEISNYARAGAQCRHNLTYWLGGDYLGIGPGAHGRLGSLALEAPRSIREWIEKGIHTEQLTPKQLLEERLIMGLRLYNHPFSKKNLSPHGMAQALAYGWIQQCGETFSITRSGRHVLDQVTLALMPE